MKEIVVSKTGLEITKINGYLCHSIYNPSKEAKKFVDKHIEDVQIHFIYGYGDGFIVNEFLERAPENNTFYVVVDPFIDIEQKTNEFALFLNFKDKVKLKQDLSCFMDYTYNKKITTSLNYDKMNLKIYKEFLGVLNELIQINKVNENTVSLFSYEWYKNYLNNLFNLDKDNSIDVLKNSTNKPAVVASGGPSLTKQLPLVKKYRKQILLIAAGSTINSLISEDIHPDIVVSIDGHINNYAHFKDTIFKKDTLFLYSMYSYPDIRDKFEKGYYFIDSSSEGLYPHLNKFSKTTPVVISGGGSVAHFALSLANYISTGPICLIGQDLAYTNGESHALNNVFRRKVEKEKDDLLEIEGYYGKNVLSDYMFISMRNVFENLVHYLDRERIYNCTEGGALIKNYKNLPFEEFCEKFTSKEYFDKKVELIEKGKGKDILKLLQEEMELYKKVEKATENNLMLLKMNKATATFKGSVLKKMDKNDKIMKEESIHTPIEIAFKSIEMKVNRNYKIKMNETPKEQFERVYNQNEFLYSEMHKVVCMGIEVLKRLIMKKKEKNHADE